MTNHPNRSRGPYTAELFSAFTRFPPLQIRAVREAKALAESYGDGADICTVRDAAGRPAAQFRRDRSTGRWFRAALEMEE